MTGIVFKNQMRPHLYYKDRRIGGDVDEFWNVIFNDVSQYGYTADQGVFDSAGNLYTISTKAGYYDTSLRIYSSIGNLIFQETYSGGSTKIIDEIRYSPITEMAYYSGDGGNIYSYDIKNNSIKLIYSSSGYSILGLSLDNDGIELIDLSGWRKIGFDGTIKWEKKGSFSNNFRFITSGVLVSSGTYYYCDNDIEVKTGSDSQSVCADSGDILVWWPNVKYLRKYKADGTKAFNLKYSANKTILSAWTWNDTFYVGYIDKTIAPTKMSFQRLADDGSAAKQTEINGLDSTFPEVSLFFDDLGIWVQSNNLLTRLTHSLDIQFSVDCKASPAVQLGYDLLLLSFADDGKTLTIQRCCLDSTTSQKIISLGSDHKLGASSYDTFKFMFLKDGALSLWFTRHGTVSYGDVTETTYEAVFGKYYLGTIAE